MGFRPWLRPGSKPLPSPRGAAGNRGVSFIQLAGTVRHAFCRGRGHWSVRCWRYNRSERPVSNLNLAHAEVLQVQHRQVRQHRASIARFETRARTAASRDRRAKPRLPRLPMCARPPLTGGGTNLNRHRKGRECEAHHTPKCFCVLSPATALQTNPAHNLRAPQEAVLRLGSEILGARYRAAAGIAAGSRST